MTLLGPLGVALAVFVAAVGCALGLLALERRGSVDLAVSVPFTGGLPPSVHGWSRYHARYYVMALVFLAFDMEMVYMYPWAVVFISQGPLAMAEMGMFIAVLLLGIVYGWRERAFAWA